MWGGEIVLVYPKTHRPLSESYKILAGSYLGMATLTDSGGSTFREWEETMMWPIDSFSMIFNLIFWFKVAVLCTKACRPLLESYLTSFS